MLAHHGIAPQPCFFPTIEAIVANGDEDVTIKVCVYPQPCMGITCPSSNYGIFRTPLQVSDQGGGVKRSQINNYYEFFTSSCKLGSRGLRWVFTCPLRFPLLLLTPCCII